MKPLVYNKWLVIAVCIMGIVGAIIQIFVIKSPFSILDYGFFASLCVLAFGLVWNRDKGNLKE